MVCESSGARQFDLAEESSRVASETGALRRFLESMKGYEESEVMSSLERAIAIAAEGHAGQVDKAGAPYILHPLRMMLSVSSNDERIVAVLHDVCEDCPGWTFDRLRQEGFPDHIIEALRSVTKREGEAYEDFVLRAATNPIGRRVKLADLHDNCDLSRIATPSERDVQRIEKYRRAIDVLNGLPG